MNKKSGEREGGLRSGLEESDRREDDDPTGELQEESDDSHENYEPL